MRSCAIVLLLLLVAPLAARAQDPAPADPAAPDGDPMAEPPVAPESPDQADQGLEDEPATGVASTERTQDGDAAVEADAEVEADNFSHDGQFALRVGMALPFVFAVKYGEGPICSHNRGDDGRYETLCRRVGAPMLDVDLAFGMTEGVELVALGRFGLSGEEPTDNNRIVVGAGIRSYGSPRSQVKAYIGVLVIADLTANNPDDPFLEDWGPADLGAAGQFGLQIEALRNLGFYIQLGAGLQMLRGLYLIGDIAAGLQVRIP